MKGYRFYKEIDTGNVIALQVDENHQPLVASQITSPASRRPRQTWYAVRSTRDTVNAPVSMGEVDREYLATECTRISESKARSYHPRLFTWFEDNQPPYPVEISD